MFDFNVAAGSVLTIRVTNVSAGSVSQIALYAPGVALGGINLLTGNSNELRCTTGNSCDDFVAGEHVDAISVQAAGTYRLAVTREWGTSCGGTGTYRLDVTSNRPFQVQGQSREDGPSAASGFECQ